MRCPTCGSDLVRQRTALDYFMYGRPDLVQLCARVPLLECASCRQAWIDHRSETSRSEVVRVYLAIKHKFDREFDPDPDVIDAAEEQEAREMREVHEEPPAPRSTWLDDPL